MKYWYLLFLYPFLISCGPEPQEETTEHLVEELDAPKDTIVPLYCNENVTVGAARFDMYLDDLEGKQVAVVGNQTSVVGDVHLVDTLLAQNVNVTVVFAPEHGFRGDADAGEHVKDGVDAKTGLPIVSLYGSNKKPRADQLSNVDVILFDIQDVGTRFYTYISTLQLVMEAAAENDKQLIVLDRPNPNGHYVAGPILEDKHESFVGKHRIPIVHGMSIGEFAQMINVDSAVNKKPANCDLKVVPLTGWDHSLFYELPIAPSPNLPNMASVYNYPHLCLFEGTVVSVGRGTDLPFQCVGHPKFAVELLESLDTVYNFTPQPNSGSKYPKLQGEECYGWDLSQQDPIEARKEGAEGGINLHYILTMYNNLGMGDKFFLSNGFIHLLAGTSTLKADIKEGLLEDEIEAKWEQGIVDFKKIRSKYLLYKDFE